MEYVVNIINFINLDFVIEGYCYYNFMITSYLKVVYLSYFMSFTFNSAFIVFIVNIYFNPQIFIVIINSAIFS